MLLSSLPEEDLAYALLQPASYNIIQLVTDGYRYGRVCCLKDSVGIMLSQEDIDQYQQLLQTHRRALKHYLQQKATLREHTPPHVGIGIEDARQEIRRVKGALRRWGVHVEDQPDDEESPNATTPSADQQSRELSAAQIAHSRNASGGRIAVMTSTGTPTYHRWTWLSFSGAAILLIILAFWLGTHLAPPNSAIQPQVPAAGAELTTAVLPTLPRAPVGTSTLEPSATLKPEPTATSTLEPTPTSPPEPTATPTVPPDYDKRLPQAIDDASQDGNWPGNVRLSKGQPYKIRECQVQLCYIDMWPPGAVWVSREQIGLPPATATPTLTPRPPTPTSQQIVAKPSCDSLSATDTNTVTTEDKVTITVCGARFDTEGRLRITVKMRNDTGRDLDLGLGFGRVYMVDNFDKQYNLSDWFWTKEESIPNEVKSGTWVEGDLAINESKLSAEASTVRVVFTIKDSKVYTTSVQIPGR